MRCIGPPSVRQFSESSQIFDQFVLSLLGRLVYCLWNRFTVGNVLQDRLHRGCPDEQLRVFAVGLEKQFHARFQRRDAVERAPAELFVARLAKQVLHQVQPRGAGRDEMQLEPRVLVQPGCEVRVPVRAVVVQDEVQTLALWEPRVHPAQGLQELLMTMTPVAVALAHDGTVQDVERGGQPGGAIALVSRRASLRSAPPSKAGPLGCGRATGSGSSCPQTAPAPYPADSDTDRPRR